MSDNPDHATLNGRAVDARNHFELFGLPVQYQLDRLLLSTRYLELTRATHPDFAGSDPEAQLQAMELSARVNEAHAVLDDDLRRAEYLLELRGGRVGDQAPADVLERIFEMRESLAMPCQPMTKPRQQTSGPSRQMAATGCHRRRNVSGQ